MDVEGGLDGRAATAGGSEVTPTKRERLAARFVSVARFLTVESLPANALERAFALAETGNYTGVGKIREQLRAEGYEPSQLYGPSLASQIRGICQRSRKSDLAPRGRPPRRPQAKE